MTREKRQQQIKELTAGIEKLMSLKLKRTSTSPSLGSPVTSGLARPHPAYSAILANLKAVETETLKVWQDLKGILIGGSIDAKSDV